MRPGAQLQAVIEMVDGYDPHLGPLDEYVQKYLKHRRYIGSHDRRKIGDYIFNIYRIFSFLQRTIEKRGLNPLTGRHLVLGHLIENEGKSLAEIQGLFTGESYHPLTLSEQEMRCLTTPLSLSSPMAPHLYYPQWLYEKLLAVFKDETEPQLNALNQQATVDLCADINLQGRDEILKILQKEGIMANKTPHSPLGLRLQKRVDLRQLGLFKQGVIDVQDEGAQLISLLCNIEPGMKVCDYCAGAGGKTRTLSILLAGQGTIIATDNSPDRLKELQKRLKRGGPRNVSVQSLSEVQHQGYETFDRVLLDVPCSGTGRLRRQVELKVSLSPEKLDQFVLLQQQILGQASSLVRPKGFLIYATCSLFQEENEMQIEWFLKNNPNYKIVPTGSVLAKVLGYSLQNCQTYLSLTPYTHGTDGFFAAILQRD